MKKLLFLQHQTVCYKSYLYFGDQLIRELKNIGFSVEKFGPDKSLEDMEQFCGQPYDAIFAFNSSLPRATMDDRTLFLDTIDAPFFNIILDHPLYHHDSLKVPLKNYHIICLDENHKRYIERFYPHIKDVHVIQMTGSMTATPPAPIAQRRFDVLFTGTYTPPEEVQQAIDQLPAFLKDFTCCLIKQLLHDSSQTLESALKQYAIETNNDVILENFPLHMQAAFLADSYIRAKKRDILIRELLKAHIPVTVCGAHWEQLKGNETKYLQIGGAFPIEDTYQIMARSKIMLNIMPEFKAGGHDRIYGALLNGCVVLTDSSSLLLKQFSTGKELVFYQPNALETVPVLIRSLLANPTLLQDIATAGFQCAAHNHTWKERATELASIIQHFSH